MTTVRECLSFNGLKINEDIFSQKGNLSNKNSYITTFSGEGDFVIYFLHGDVISNPFSHSSCLDLYLDNRYNNEAHLIYLRYVIVAATQSC